MTKKIWFFFPSSSHIYKYSKNYKLNINFVVEEKWTDLLQLVLITVIGAYFGGRSFEKRQKK